MSASLNTGRSDHQIINETTGSFRPQADVRQSIPESLLRSAKGMIGPQWPDHADWKL